MVMMPSEVALHRPEVGSDQLRKALAGLDDLDFRLDRLHRRSDALFKQADEQLTLLLK